MFCSYLHKYRLCLPLLGFFVCLYIAATSALQYQGLDQTYARFERWNISANGTLRFQFKTRLANALLMYSDINGRHDFIKIVVDGPEIVFSIRLNNKGRTLKGGENINDGKWHSAMVSYRSSGTVREVSLSVDGHRREGSVEAGDPEITAKSDLFVGGIPADAVATIGDPVVATIPTFRGHIRNINVKVKGKKFKRLALIEKQGVDEDPTDLCSNNDPCLNQGLCYSDDQSSRCECVGTGYEGAICEDVIEEEARPSKEEEGKQATSATFNGHSYISFSLQRSRIVSNNDDIVFEFRTVHPNGLILHVGEQYDYIYVAIIDGVLEVAVNLGSGEYHTRVEPRGNKQDRYMDNEWHKVRISRDRKQVSIRVDESLLASGETGGDFGTLTADGEFFVGGASDPRSLPGSNVGENFVGNLRDVFYYGSSETIEILDKARTANSFIFIEGEVIFEVTDVEAIDPITFQTEEAFLRLPRWNAEMKGTISFSFRTNEPDAVIMYAKGAEGMSDFFAFELLDGYLYLVLDLGSGAIRHKRNTFPLNDGEWHTVTLMRERNTGHLQVDADKEDKKFEVPGTSNHLNLETELFLGGIDQSESNKLPMDLFSGVLRRGYVGCIKNLAIDGETIDLPRYVLKESRDDIGAFCREEQPHCDSNPCEHEGICTEGWNRFVCDCTMTGYTGKTCSDEVARLSFNGHQYMKITLPDSARSKVEDINLRFKTRHPNGVLVATTSDTVIDLLMIELKNGAVKVSANYGHGLTSITAGTNLDDNRWHSIHVSRNDDTLTLSVDDVDRAEVGDDFEAGILDYRYIEVGAISSTENFEEVPLNFQGHMEQFLYNNQPYFDLAREAQITGYELTAQFGERITQRPIREPFTFMTKEVHVQLPTPATYDPHLTLFFQFKTTEPDGLIVYCGDGTDFITIELVEGRIHYAFDLGGGTTVMKANTRTLLNDNLWHEVSISRDSRDRHVLKVDDSATIARPGAGKARNLDLTENLYIGGVEGFRYQFLPMMVEATQGFQGCFASLEINGEHQKLLETAVSIEAKDEIIEGCEDQSQLCEDHGCENGGICVPGWNSYTCNCDMTSFVGETCANVSTTFAFGSSSGLITLRLPETDWLRTDRDDLSLGFITIADDAVLVRVDSATSDDFLEMEVVKGVLFVRYNFGTDDHPIGELDHKVNDGHYHIVQFSRKGANATLQVDSYAKVFKFPKGKQARYFDDQAVVNIGGRGTGATGDGVRKRRSMERSFVGLISGLNYNDYKILDMAASGDDLVSVTGDVRQVDYPERAILSSMPPMLTDPEWAGTPTSGPIITPASPSGTIDEPSPGGPTPTKNPMRISPTDDAADKVDSSDIIFVTQSGCGSEDDEDCVPDSGSVTSKGDDIFTPSEDTTDTTKFTPADTTPSSTVTLTPIPRTSTEGSGCDNGDPDDEECNPTVSGNGPDSDGKAISTTKNTKPPDDTVVETPGSQSNPGTSEGLAFIGQTGMVIGLVAAGALIFLLIVVIIYKCRNRNEGSYRINESRNYDNVNEGGAGTRSALLPQNATNGTVPTKPKPKLPPEYASKEWYV